MHGTLGPRPDPAVIIGSRTLNPASESPLTMITEIVIHRRSTAAPQQSSFIVVARAARPVSTLGVILVLVGAALMVAEAHVPSHGALGTGAATALTAGVVLALSGAGAPGGPSWQPVSRSRWPASRSPGCCS